MFKVKCRVTFISMSPSITLQRASYFKRQVYAISFSLDKIIHEKSYSIFRIIASIFFITKIQSIFDYTTVARDKTEIVNFSVSCALRRPYVSTMSRNFIRCIWRRAPFIESRKDFRAFICPVRSACSDWNYCRQFGSRLCAAPHGNCSLKSALFSRLNAQHPHRNTSVVTVHFLPESSRWLCCEILIFEIPNFKLSGAFVLSHFFTRDIKANQIVIRDL